MRLIVAVVGVAALTATVAACGGGDSTSTATSTPPGTEPDAAATEPGATAPGSPTTTASDTPTAFESQRDALAQRLDAIGANIGFVPDDIRDELLGECRALAEQANSGEVNQLCDGIAQAIEDGDPGRIDLVLAGLAELTEG